MLYIFYQNKKDPPQKTAPSVLSVLPLSLSVSWTTHSGRSWLLCLEDTKAALWRCPHGKQLKFLDNTSEKLATPVSKPSWKRPPGPSQSTDDAALADILTITSKETLS